MIYGESFNAIFDAIERIEQHIGLRYYTDDETVNGRLNNLEVSASYDGIRPYCEVDIPIAGDNFEVTHTPILIGDAWVVNNSVVITVIDSPDKVVHEWGDIEFNGTTGTLMGAGGIYDGKTVTLTYFFKEDMLYYDIVFENGYPETQKIGSIFFDLIIEDEVTDENQRIFIDSKGRVSSYAVQESITGVNSFADTTNGLVYELYSENGHINWRTI